MGRNRTLGSPYEGVTVTASFRTVAEVDMYRVDAPAGGVTATLDPNAVDGDQVVIQDISNLAGTEPITVVPGGGQTILNGFGSSYSINTNGAGVLFTYDFGASGWVPEPIGTFSGGLPENVGTNGSIPTITLTDGPGVGSTASLSSNANDTAGQFTIVATGGGDGPQATITFAKAFAATPRAVVVTAGSLFTSENPNIYVTAITATSFQLGNSVAFSPGTYIFNYIVLG